MWKLRNYQQNSEEGCLIEIEDWERLQWVNEAIYFYKEGIVQTVIKIKHLEVIGFWEERCWVLNYECWKSK